MERPFSEEEKRFVLAEAIKTSSIPIERLLIVLSESQVQPAWLGMLLPTGRNLKSCIETFDALRSSPLPSFPSLAHPPHPQAAVSSNKRKPVPDTLESLSAGPIPKRRQSGADTIAPARTIQPRPASNGSPQSFSPLAAGQQPKKRGRPSKADVEARNAEAIARGEVIPPPRASGPRNPQMVGVGQFDARSPAQRELVPSPRILAPSLPIGGDANVGSFSAGSQMSSPAAAIASIVATGPSSPPGAKIQSGLPESEETAASGKKKRVRPGSKQTKPPKMGEGSFQAINPPVVQPPSDAGPVAAQPPREQYSPILPRSDPERPPSTAAPAPAPGPPVEPQIPAAIQHPPMP